MFRLNFLTVILCLVMNRPYQFYYFVPLVSFWYSVFHLTAVLPPRLSRPSHANSEHSPFNYFYCIVKFVILGGFITILYLSEVSCGASPWASASLRAWLDSTKAKLVGKLFLLFF